MTSPMTPQQILPEIDPEMLDIGIEAGMVPAGTPEEVARGVQSFADTGADQLVFGMSMLPLDLAIGSLELFSKEVLPLFDKDPEHDPAIVEIEGKPYFQASFTVTEVREPYLGLRPWISWSADPIPAGVK